MKLLACIECSDVFSLTRKVRRCGCGMSAGVYRDNLNAEITGPCQPIGFSNASFIKSLQLQKIEDKYQPTDPSCCKGVEFDAFFIPAAATSVKRVDSLTK